MNDQAPSTEKVSLNDLLAKKVGRPPPMRTMKVAWFPMRDAVTGMSMLQHAPEAERGAILSSLRPTIVTYGEPCPFDKTSVVVGLFDDDEIRVYCLGETTPPTRYRLSKTSPVWTMDKLELDAFVDELANDFIEMRDEMSSAELEREAILQYGADMANTLPGATPYSLQDFLSDIKEGVHVSDEDEADEEDEDEGTTVIEPPKLTAVPTPAS